MEISSGMVVSLQSKSTSRNRKRQKGVRTMVETNNRKPAEGFWEMGSRHLHAFISGGVAGVRKSNEDESNK